MPELTQIKLGSSLSAVKLWHMYVTKMWMGTLCKWKQKTNFRVILSENRVTGSVVDHKTTYTRRGHVSRWLRGSGCSHPPLTREAPSSIRIWSPTVSTVSPPFTNVCAIFKYNASNALLIWTFMFAHTSPPTDKGVKKMDASCSILNLFSHDYFASVPPMERWKSWKVQLRHIVRIKVTNSSWRCDCQSVWGDIWEQLKIGGRREAEGGGWGDYLNVPTTIAH